MRHLTFVVTLKFSPSVLLSCKGKPALLVLEWEERSVLSQLPALCWIRVWGPRQTLNPFILLQYQSWHKPAVISSVALSGEWLQASPNTPAFEWPRPNDVGKKWKATEGGNKERGGFFLSSIPNLVAETRIYTLFEKQRLHLQRDLPVCVGLGNVSSMPSHPPPAEAVPSLALLGWPLCWVSSIDATLPRHDSKQPSTSTLKIHPSL